MQPPLPWCKREKRCYWTSELNQRAVERAYATFDRGRENNRATVVRYAQWDPEKARAHGPVYYAKDNGKLVVPDGCTRCGIFTSATTTMIAS